MLEVYNPYSNKLVDSVKACTSEDIDKAIEKLRDYSFNLGNFERSEILKKASDLLKERQKEFADLIVQEIGVSTKDAVHEVDRSVNVIDICSEEAKRIGGEITPSEISKGFNGRLIYSIREPIGIVLCITPFNHPLNQVVHKIIPALASNNAVLLKPSRKSPLSAIKIVELLYEAGFKKEMLQVITGEDSVIGKDLVSNKHINMISFTGSVNAGEIISSNCGIKKVSLELGGNDALVVDDTADINLAVKMACDGAFKNSGQRCSSVKRIILLPSVKKEFEEKFVKAVKSLKVGDPRNPETDIGTVIDEESAILIEKRIQKAVAEGANILTGGERNRAQVMPTVLNSVEMRMELVKEETFGPVAPIIDCDSFENAIDIVNQTSFGLNAALCSNNHENIRKFIKSVVVGGVRINAPSSFRNEILPFGGINDSGYGRGGIIYAMKEMSNLKTVLT